MCVCVWELPKMKDEYLEGETVQNTSGRKCIYPNKQRKKINLGSQRVLERVCVQATDAALVAMDSNYSLCLAFCSPLLLGFCSFHIVFFFVFFCAGERKSKGQCIVQVTSVAQQKRQNMATSKMVKGHRHWKFLSLTLIG